MRYASVLGAALVATAALLSPPAQAVSVPRHPRRDRHRAAAGALHLDSVPLHRGACG